MLLDISVALKNPGEIFDFSTRIAVEPQNIYGQTYYISSVNVDGIYTVNEDDIILSGNVSFVVTTQCARCLNNVEKNINAKFSESFSSKDKLNNNDADEYNDERSIFYDDYKINLSRLIEEIIITNIPLKMVCEDNCNNIVSTIEDVLQPDNIEQDNPFLILKDVFNNDEEV